MLLGVLATIVLVTLAMKLPDRLPSAAIELPVLFAMYGLAKALQGSIYSAHVESGGTKASAWSAAGIGVLCLVVLFVGIVAWVIIEDQFLTSRVYFGPEEEVIFESGATEAEAKKLGTLLQAEGYFDGKGAKSVRISRAGGRAVVEFVLQQNAWFDPQVVKQFEELKPKLSKAVFDGAPVEIRLVDEDLETHKTL
jgi:hypothetical protein